MQDNRRPPGTTRRPVFFPVATLSREDVFVTLAAPWNRFSIRLVSVALLVSLGCTGPGAQPGHVAPLRREILSRDEIMSSSAQHGDLYDAIRSLRPNFLMRDPGVHSNASTSSLPVAVFIGNARQG